MQGEHSRQVITDDPANPVAVDYAWHEYPLENFSMSVEVSQCLAFMGSERLLAHFRWKMARLPEMGVLRTPDGWVEAFKEALYTQLARSRWAALRQLSGWARRNWPVRYRVWEALALVPGLQDQPLPRQCGAVKVAVFRPSTGRAA